MSGKLLTMKIAGSSAKGDSRICFRENWQELSKNCSWDLEQNSHWTSETQADKCTPSVLGICNINT